MILKKTNLKEVITDSLSKKLNVVNWGYEKIIIYAI